MEFENKEKKIGKEKEKSCTWAVAVQFRPTMPFPPRGPSPFTGARRTVGPTGLSHAASAWVLRCGVGRQWPWVLAIALRCLVGPPCQLHLPQPTAPSMARARIPRSSWNSRPWPRSYRSGTRSVSFPSSFYPRDPRPTPPVPSDNPAAIVAV